jgi:heptosyltransferase-2
MDRKSLLVIRGGAIGDFLLTLPAIRLLREAFPGCRLEIVGYRHICAIAGHRYYADTVRSIEYAPMAGFFNPRSILDPNLSEYFSGFGQVISYLFDPDGIFESNLQRCGVRHLISADPRVNDGDHAAIQLARPLECLGLFLDDPAATLFPNDTDRLEAANLLRDVPGPFLVIHPGSGSDKKNWPLDRWIGLVSELTDSGHAILAVGGECDAARLQTLHAKFPEALTILEGVPLTTLAAVIERASFFVGHDSGISHLAAAAGTRCLLLFGPTDPAVWAPRNPGVQVLAHPRGSLAEIPVADVLEHCRNLMETIPA